MGEAPPLMACPPPSQPASNPAQSLEPITELITEPIIESDSLFQRRIEFHMARKISNGFGNCGGDKGGFQMEVLNPECGSGAGMNSNSVARVMKKPEGGDRNGLDSELLSLRLTFKRIGAGLQNLGNTCFLNSVLQCLTYTEPLAAYLQSGKHQTSCRAAGFCALCAIQRHVSRALNSSGRIVAPKDLVSNLRCISRNFRNSRQEDAHEYMVNLLESMHKCCLPSGVPSESPSAYERSLVHKIFGGRLCSQVKCLQCSYCSNKFDPFLDLSLEILKADTLYKALTHFTAKEQLDGGARQYQCQQCKQKVKALKQLTIYNPPHVLAIHLKRFGSHVQGQKINKKVDFGPTIDLKPFVTGSYDGDLKYTLYGVLVHAGWSTHSGHYYCFVRTSSGIWYSLDDNQVVQVGERKVLEQKAYMLFYVRDQKNFIPKIAVHKETVTNFKGSKGSMQTIPIEGESNGFGSHTSTKGNAVNASALNEALVKLPADDRVSKADRSRPLYMNAKNSASVTNSSLSNQNASALNRGLVKIQADSNGLKVNHTSLDVKNSLSMKDSTVANLDVDKKVAASTEKATDSNMDAAANDRTSTLTLENGDRKIVNASAAELCQLTVPHFAAKENKCDPCKIISSCNGHAGVNKSVIDSVGRPFDSDGPSTAKDASYFMKTQKVEISKLGDSSQTDIDVGQKPELPTTLEILPQKKLAYRTSHLAVGKKFFRTPIMKMQLSTTIIFRKTLGIRNRKKPRGGRSCNLVNKKSGQDQLADRNFSESGLGPSTSENCEMPLHGLSTSSHDKKKKGNKSGGIDATVLAESEKIIGEVNGRVCLNDHIVSTEKQQIEGYKSERADLAWSAGKRKEVNKNGVTTVLQETTVPRWDDVEVPVASVMESDKQESISIGYIGDEWDEDYDRGKQKKVRMNKFDFDGSNPFQETANRKAKRHFQETPSRKAKRRHKMEFGPGTKRFKV